MLCEHICHVDLIICPKLFGLLRRALGGSLAKASCFNSMTVIESLALYRYSHFSSTTFLLSILPFSWWKTMTVMLLKHDAFVKLPPKALRRSPKSLEYILRST